MYSACLKFWLRHFSTIRQPEGTKSCCYYFELIIQDYSKHIQSGMQHVAILNGLAAMETEEQDRGPKSFELTDRFQMPFYRAQVMRMAKMAWKFYVPSALVIVFLPTIMQNRSGGHVSSL